MATMTSKKGLELQWMADLKAESDLQSLSVPFDVITIPFHEINLEESLYNGARTGNAVIQKLVDDYKIGMKNGDTFPRPVLRTDPSGFVILGGNQRCTSIKELIEEEVLPKKMSIEAYVVDTDDKMMTEIITRSGNVGHGGRSDKDERTAHAVYSVQSLGMRTHDAAKIFMVSDSTILQHIRASEERDNLAANGIDAKAIPISGLDALSKLDADVKPRLGQLVAQHLPSTERIKAIVSKVKQAKTTTGRLQAVKSFEVSLADEVRRNPRKKANEAIGHKVPARPRRDRLISMMNRLAEFLDCGCGGESFKELSDCQIVNSADEKELTDAWGRIKFQMSVLLATHK